MVGVSVIYLTAGDKIMKKLYLISMCMIMLIMSFPVANAQTLSIIKIQGQDGIENYYRANDVISIEVLAGMPGETAVERDQSSDRPVLTSAHRG